jgi:hypothetical protein
MESDWIDAMTDDDCLEVFRLYTDAADELLARHGAVFIAHAVRYALYHVAQLGTSGTEERPPIAT